MRRFVPPLMTVVSLGIFCASIPPANAQTDKKAPPKTTQAAKTYFVCSKCKTYFSDSAAKKMSYKDAMGHKLTWATAIPKGFTDGSKATPRGKMDSGKMSSKTKM